jgi:hypothetical protein
MRALLLTLFMFVLLTASYATKAQKLFLINKTLLRTNWRELLDVRTGNGVVKAFHRFGKDDEGYYLELKVFRDPGHKPILSKAPELINVYFTKEDKVQFTLLMNKGIVILPVRDTNIIHLPDSKVDCSYVRFAATEAQLNDLIQNKSVNLMFTGSGEKVEKEMRDDLNFDIRSAASAILIQRDIRGEKLHIHEKTLTGKKLIE